MGLFSKTKVSVFTSNLRLVEDTPNLLGQSVVSSVYGNRPIATDLVANILRGLGSKADAYYRYGRDKYYFGLPQGFEEYSPADSNTVKLVVDHELTKDVVMDFSIYEVANADYFAYEHMQSVRGWDPVSNVVSNPPFDSEGEIAYFKTARFLSPTKIEIQYSYGQYIGVETITVPVVNTSAGYYHVGYYDTPEDTVRKYWFYDTSKEIYPTLKVGLVEDSPYYPIVPLRRNNEDWTTDDGSERYRTSKRLLDRLGLKIGELGDGINGNPDVGEVDHAYVILGIDVQTDVQESKDYLFRYFKYLHERSIYTREDYIQWGNLPVNPRAQRTPKMNVVKIEEEDYKTELGFLFSESVIVDGVLGPKYKKGYVETKTVLNAPQETDSYKYETSVFKIRKQISTTQYEEIRIHGLKHVSHIYQGHTVDTSLEDSLNEDVNNLIIPLHSKVFQEMNILKRTEIMYDALRIVFNSVVIQKLKWYETGFFKLVLVIVAVVITIVSYGTLGESMAVAMGFTAGSASAAIVGAIMYAAITIALQYGFKLLVDVLGVEAAFVIAIIAAVVGVVGQINGAWFGDVALQVQSGFTTGINSKMEDILSEISYGYEQLQAEMDAAWLELEEMSAGLNTDGLIDPMLLLQNNSGLAKPYETPEQYYNTRIHSGNIGTNAFKVAEHYVRSNLLLEGITEHQGLV